MRNLEKLFWVACAVFFFTSCEETYNDKLFWPGEISQEYGSYIKPYTLDLTYSGEKLIGKTVSFKTEDSETGTLTLNDVIPGEASTPINGIKLYENEEKGNYTFSGTNITMGGATVKYSGSITPKAMKLAVDVKMANSSELAKNYSFGTFEMITNDEEFLYVKFKGAAYLDMIPKEGFEDDAVMMSIIGVIGGNILQILIPQLIKDIKIEDNGTIIANYSSDPIDMEKIMSLVGQENAGPEIQKLVNSRTYLPSPTGLAYWSKVNGKFLLKLNIPAIINEVIKNSQQQVDSGLINGITEAIFKTDPIRLKNLLGILNTIINNQVLGYIVNTDETTFSALFSCIKDGIPMNITHTEDGHTYLYLDYQTLTPIINVVSGIKVDLGGIELDLSMMLGEPWKLMETVNIGLDLVPVTQ
ncbi:DUF4925 domain-containing protein [Bacteroides faecium]|uniref:DUF4925 domain-containing protein n=1 Tax=Bacteroides faecium TaxID=2715212 RepID=A0A6H0KV38_9BACE|nr:DUF4925 domain-containing protein [Bacteroides faecium]QIU97013.1 DUF4925 domain-containing protein [Bacteroides faecium]